MSQAPGARLGRCMGQDLLLHGAIAEDFGGVEEAKLFGGAAPGATAGAGASARMRSAVRRWRAEALGVCLAGEIGRKAWYFLMPAAWKRLFQVMEDGFADVGDGEFHVGIEVVGEDGFAAAGGAGVPEECGRGQGRPGRGGGGFGGGGGTGRSARRWEL
jgi:hypothetical protein